MEEEITKEQALFVMDYASNLNECEPKFRLTVLDGKSLDKAIGAMILYQEALKITNIEIEKYRQAINKKYYSKELDFALIDLKDDICIELDVY
ncbi:hypothetical protein DCCM_0982 [Desulfocucumis palustris]|uniref:Uncharacterized protein n=1 Tax=Desulfocucumis palustris TaxID=1898651 RepID=A0A2L2XEX6_9FIRM|nr:hypothetical protein DCCM_0982 [Desulfocucumis palustris]